ncbi:unnamed protein product [Camellia sinensis]
MQYSGFNAPFPTGAANLPSLSPLVTSNPDTNAVIPPISNKTNAISGPTLPYQTISQPISSIVGSLGTSSSSQTETPTPLLVTPGQLLQFSPSSTSVSAQIHPLVVFNSCDCYVRRPDQAERIIGTLLGPVLPDGTVDIRNSYAVPHSHQSQEANRTMRRRRNPRHRMVLRRHDLRLATLMSLFWHLCQLGLQ